MRKIISILWLVMAALVIAPMAGTIHAQVTTPTPYPPADLETWVRRAEDAANRAEFALDEAAASEQRTNDAISLMANLLGIFEALTAILGVVVPVLAILAGFLGIRGLNSATDKLREAQERFERDMQRREAEFDTLRDELKNSVQKQRETAAKASLALSLLPLGERQYRAQDYAGALDTYRRAMELDPDNPITHYRLGYVYTQSGELELATQHLTRALELDPQFVPSRAALGYVYRRRGDKMSLGVERDIMYNRAEEHFLRALHELPKLVDEDGESWWGSLGGLYRRRGQIEQAIYAYERCSEVTPQSSYPISNLALLYATTHNRRRMIETYKRVEQLAWREAQADVDNYWAYADLLAARLAQGKVKEAGEILDTTLTTAPADSPYTLEMLLDTLQRLSAALESQERPAIEQVIGYIREFQAKRRQSQPPKA